MHSTPFVFAFLYFLIIRYLFQWVLFRCFSIHFHFKLHGIFSPITICYVDCRQRNETRIHLVTLNDRVFICSRALPSRTVCSKCQCECRTLLFQLQRRINKFLFALVFCVFFSYLFFFFHSFNRLIYWTQSSAKNVRCNFFFASFFLRFSNKSFNRFVQTRAQRDFYCSVKVFELLLFSNCSFRMKTLSQFFFSFRSLHGSHANFRYCAILVGGSFCFGRAIFEYVSFCAIY